MRRRDPLPGRRSHRVALPVDVVLLDDVGLQRPERVEPDVQRHPLDVEPREQPVREVQTGGRRGSRALLARVDGLVPLGIGERLGDVRRQRRLPGRLAAQPHAPAALAQMLEQLHRAVRVARRADGRVGRASASQTSPSTRSSSSTSPARRVDRDPRRHDSRVVDDGEDVARQELGEITEDAVLHRRRVARSIDEQARLVAAVGGMLRDQLRRQVVVELTGLHPVRTVASALVELSTVQIREAMTAQPARGGGPDLAAPRRGERPFEQRDPPARAARGAIESERNARVDDLGLLVDLLTEAGGR